MMNQKALPRPILIAEGPNGIKNLDEILSFYSLGLNNRRLFAEFFGRFERLEANVTIVWRAEGRIFEEQEVYDKVYFYGR